MIFDTDVLIWCFRGDSNAEAAVESCLDRTASIVSIMEMLQGARSKSEIQLIRGFIPFISLEVIPINESISYVAARLIEEHTLAAGLELPDALIAATACERGATLMTGNVRHFRSIPLLDIKPFRPSTAK